MGILNEMFNASRIFIFGYLEQAEQIFNMFKINKSEQQKQHYYIVIICYELAIKAAEVALLCPPITSHRRMLSMLRANMPEHCEHTEQNAQCAQDTHAWAS